MGSYDGAETCELVGNFLLSQLQHVDINNIGSDCRFVHYATCQARTIKGTGIPFSAVAAVGISVAGFIKDFGIVLFD